MSDTYTETLTKEDYYVLYSVVSDRLREERANGGLKDDITTLQRLAVKLASL
jgi:hypothetical protein